MAEMGFLKRSQKFRNDTRNENYFPILDKLSEIAQEHRNMLPSSFEIKDCLDITFSDVKFVLDNLYPEKNYSCNKGSINTIFCIRH